MPTTGRTPTRSQPPVHTAEDERERLRVVYRDYRQDSGVALRWAAANPGNAAIVAERNRAASELVAAWGGLAAGSRLLDIGCGETTTLGPDIARGDVIHLGVDILFERVAAARQAGRLRAEACADGAALPLRSSSVDLATLYTVFSSVGDRAICVAIADEIQRVLRPGGAVLWYDFRYRNPSNRHTHAVTRNDAETYFHGFEHHWQRVTLLPPLARRLGRFTPPLYRVLGAVPGARSHLLGLFVKGK